MSFILIGLTDTNITTQVKNTSQKLATEIIVTNMTLDQLFIEMQPDEKSRQEAIEFIRNNPIGEGEMGQAI